MGLNYMSEQKKITLKTLTSQEHNSPLLLSFIKVQHAPLPELLDMWVPHYTVGVEVFPCAQLS